MMISSGVRLHPQSRERRAISRRTESKQEMVTASGVVFRADVADGFDGVATAIFIGYPWEI